MVLQMSHSSGYLNTISTAFIIISLTDRKIHFYLNIGVMLPRKMTGKRFGHMQRIHSEIKFKSW